VRRCPLMEFSNRSNWWVTSARLSKTIGNEGRGQVLTSPEVLEARVLGKVPLLPWKATRVTLATVFRAQY